MKKKIQGITSGSEDVCLKTKELFQVNLGANGQFYSISGCVNILMRCRDKESKL